jgi:hypothetical protein
MIILDVMRANPTFAETNLSRGADSSSLRRGASMQQVRADNG